MEIANAIILGIIEGITEFLPVSSTGHLILAEQVFGFEDKEFADSFSVIIQSGAVFAVVLYFWRRFWPFGLRDKPETRASIQALWQRTIVASIPFVLMALILQKPIKGLLFHPVPVALALVLWGVAIVAIEAYQRRRDARGIKPRPEGPEQLDWKTVIFIGLFQCLALVPGTSRSAATIVGAMLLGVSRVAAAEFSFFLAIPVLLGAGAYELVSADLAFSGQEWLVILAGLGTSFVVAYAVVALFMGLIRRSRFTAFGWYRIVLGGLVLVLAALGWFTV